jgi:hypothetical protein
MEFEFKVEHGVMISGPVPSHASAQSLPMQMATAPLHTLVTQVSPSHTVEDSVTPTTALVMTLT